MIVVRNGPTQDHFSKSQGIINFSGLKKYKKGDIEMTEKIYLETLRSVLGRSITHYLNITKFLRAAVFIERLRWLFLSNHREY